MLKIGCHVKCDANGYFLGSVKQALDFGANTFMLYTGAPQNTLRVALDKFNIDQGQQLWSDNGYCLEDIVVHAPYIINLANCENPDKFAFSCQILSNEINRAKALGVKYIVVHPGSSLKATCQQGLDQVVKALDIVLENEDEIIICLETMAGKGKEVGTTFEQLAYIVNNCKKYVGICLDSCHINDAGYDLNDVDGIVKHFDEVIGLERLHVIHVNDSKNPLGSHIDRHENIGKGTIGYHNLNNLVHHPALKDKIFILETPYVDGVPIYKEEIEMLRSK